MAVAYGNHSGQKKNKLSGREFFYSYCRRWDVYWEGKMSLKGTVGITLTYRQWVGPLPLLLLAVPEKNS